VKLSDQLVEAAMRTPDELVACGNCYEDAASATLLFGAHKGWNLVHGRPTLQRPPYVQFGHAWLEKDEKVFDPSANYATTRAAYYAVGKIDHRDNLVYTSEETRRFVLAYEHWGPWEGVDGDGKPPTSYKRMDIERRYGPLKRTLRSKAPRQTKPPIKEDRFGVLEGRKKPVHAPAPKAALDAFMAEYTGFTHPHPFGGGERLFGSRQPDATEADWVTLKLRAWDGHIHIEWMQVFPNAARRGAASRALKALTDLADKHGVQMGLHAKPVGGPKIPKVALKALYSKFGFATDSGDDMLRDPVSK